MMYRGSCVGRADVEEYQQEQTDNGRGEERADKLFLMASGITLDFGLSHHTISEATIKRAMILSAQEVIVLADHTAFGAEVGIQIAPINVAHR